jgi:serine/threonine protein kinase
LLLACRLSGTLPFYADNPDDFLELVLNSKFSFPDSEWAGISEQGKPVHSSAAQISIDVFAVLVAAKDLIRKVLVPDPKRRLTSRQILAHPWMVG